MVRFALRTLAAALWVAGMFAGSAAQAAEGVRGRASLEGALVPGVEVRVFPYRPGTFGPLTGEAPIARVVCPVDRPYEIPVPPGRYVIEALKKVQGNIGKGPETGDLHCLYAGSPVTVTPGAWSAVGLNLVKVQPEERHKAGQPGLTGRITWKGREAEKVYLYAYDEVGSAFHGPARVLQPVAKGFFRFRAPPGTYYLVARKRARGGPYGPIEAGDLFNFYPRNPVVLGPGEEVKLEIPLVERRNQLEEDPAAYQGMVVRVVDPAGKGVVGCYVLAYGTAQRSGPPLATSSRTDKDGLARLPLPPGQKAYLRARRTLGGPLASGELSADATVDAGSEAEVTLRLSRVP